TPAVGTDAGSPYTVTISATNSGGTGSATLTLTINPPPPPVVQPPLSATGQVGVAFSYTITATNNPTSYNATGLPAGLSVNTSTGVISGTPATGTDAGSPPAALYHPPHAPCHSTPSLRHWTSRSRLLLHHYRNQ